MSLPDEVRAKYVDIIDEILADADLTVISAKAVRKGIQAKVEFDITPHKNAINDLIGTRFDVAEVKQKARAKANENGAEKPVPSVETGGGIVDKRESSAPTTNGVHKSSDSSAANTPSTASSTLKREADDDDSLSDVIDAPPKKKQRKASEEDDAMIAARLQAEEDRRARPTRGGTSRKSAPSKKKKTPKKKSKNKIGSDDDSDLEGAEKPKRAHGNTGFHKPLNLSPELSALLSNQAQLSRPQVTKQLWDHIKAKDLQDPADKRHILCDEPMRAVFKTDRVHMFQMTKIANTHLYPVDE